MSRLFSLLGNLVRSGLVILVLAVAVPAFALPVTVDLASGTTGTVLLNQSTTNTMTADVTVLGVSNLSILSMTLNGLDIFGTPATVGARIYTSGGSLLASSSSSLVGAGNDQSVTTPISATLVAGQSYRVGFFVSEIGNADVFDPDPPFSGGFPYTESSGLFQINGSAQVSGDVFPTVLISSLGIRLIELEVVPEPSTALLLGAGLLGLAVRGRRRTQ